MEHFEHRRTASLALENAFDIAEDVNLLVDAERWARSLSLAVIGCEEAGKALLHVFAALELAPAVVAAFEEKKWTSPLSNHLFKQLAVDMIGGADAELDSYEMAAAGELPGYPPPERTARIVCGCARTLSEMFIQRKGVAAGKAWFDGLRSMLSRPRFMPPYETPDDEKMRGLYVDLGRTSGQPKDVTRRDAVSRLSTLESTLSILGHLRECLKDDHLWEELCEELALLRDQYA